MDHLISWIKDHKIIASIVGAIGFLSSVLGIYQFFVVDLYPTVTLDIADFQRPHTEQIEARELEFLEQLYREWDQDHAFVIDMRLGDFRETAFDEDESFGSLRVYDTSVAHLSRTLNFVSVFVDRGCHDQAIVFQAGDQCAMLAIYFDKPATTSAHSSNIGEDHPIARITNYDGPQSLTFIFDAAALEIESSEFELRIYGYGKLVHGSGGQGEHHFNFRSRPFDLDKLERSISWISPVEWLLRRLDRFFNSIPV